MDSNPAPQIFVHRTLIDAIIMNNVIEASRSLSEGLLVAFEGCEANGFPLTQVQKQEIMQCLIFCFRNNEQDMTANANFMLNMQQAYNEGDIDLDIDTEDSV